LFDLPFALVARSVQNFKVILLSQMRREQAHRREVHESSGEHVQNHWMPAPGARGLDPSVGSVLGQMKNVRAVREERGTALTEVETTRVEFSEGRYEIGGCQALVCSKSFDLSEQFLVREFRGNMNRRHVFLYHRHFGALRIDDVTRSGRFGELQQ
jgi:hypothetical protein